MSLSPPPIGHRFLTHESIPADIILFSEAGGEASVSKSELARIRGFEIKDAGVKGLGIFSLQKFYWEDLVIAEAPLFSIQRGYREDNDDYRGLSQKAVEAAVNALAPEKRREYESLQSTHPDKERKWGIFATNVYGISDDSCGIFLRSSRFNHSCSPNARFSSNEEMQRLEIYALRDIARGDEILVTYLSCRKVYGSTRAERQVRLRSLGFTCSCVVCTQPETVASDQRRARLKKIWESLPHFTPNQSRQYLLAIDRATRLLEEEGYIADYEDFADEDD